MDTTPDAVDAAPEDPLRRLLAIMARLRDPDTGCPWDLEQDFRSIVPHTLEEAYEVADAIERGGIDSIRDELGDLLFQVVFYAQLGEERGAFDFDAVADGIAEKIVRRHPHVFGDTERPGLAEQSEMWEAIKARERAAGDDGEAAHSALDDIPLALPALPRSVKLQRRAARVGFDWGEPGPVFAKIREELAELEAEIAAGDCDGQEAEMGDILFACANLSRHLGVDPERALRRTNHKFERRFRGLEARLREAGVAPAEAGFKRLEAAYQAVKAAEEGQS